ncbi:helix-turn-helix domain-containing protein [Actinomadura kijaniata]|uniref:DNA-binding transcriptional ArsR family regulator n=1 Tax=Actinomadura namibiensis TaxID=182080 RepID=A0A7W3QRG2_ACTNM|nr:helix-turn-helix domain-containing protein [Actinomadura namibiensis]MBA8956714.1 DNA-binding transcriptional ArsR family regulator [Actinomadura namibiensis]
MRELHHPAADEIDLSAVLFALADPVRRGLVAGLADGAEAGTGDCAGDLPPSTASHHFKTLREAGVTRTRVAGTRRLVSLRRDDLEARFPGLLDAILRADREPQVRRG